ncbi:MAG: TIGR02710 family CRISPR-associated CARF protein [Verrucomicrobiota bacterium JB023]|nr:TIGR02710 family CRISPR-associated CARF protein [Verrucomicrobiota bacterium JB023]
MTTIYLATLGGAPTPVFYPLSRLPDLARAIFLASEESARSSQSHFAEVPDNIEVKIVTTPDPNDLVQCYEVFRKVLLNLPSHQTAPSSLLCNITGGTKPMSAALMMLATEFQLPMTYIGGAQRDKDGVGTVVPGHEKELPQQNPWKVLGLTEIRRVKNLWNSANFTAASDLLLKAAERTGSPLWTSLGRLAEAHAARLRFDFTTANKILKTVRRELPDNHPLQESLFQLRKTCETLANSSTPGKGNPSLLLNEILGSSALAAEQNRFEDAAARLYRAIEFWAQLHLHEQSNGSYWNGQLRYYRNEDKTRGEPYSVPSPLTQPSFLETIRCRNPFPERLGLSDLFLALDALGFSPAQLIAADILQGRKRSRFLQLSEKRNASILAHGTLAVTAEKFSEMNESLRKLIPEFPPADSSLILPPDFQESWLAH